MTMFIVGKLHSTGSKKTLQLAEGSTYSRMQHISRYAKQNYIKPLEKRARGFKAMACLSGNGQGSDRTFYTKTLPLVQLNPVNS